MARESSVAPSRVIGLLRSPYYWPDADPEFHAALERLTTRPEMAPVWDGLSNGYPAPYFPELFLDACMVALMQWSRISKVPAQVIESDLAQIRRIAKRLALLLRIHEADLSLRDTPTTVASLIRKDAQLKNQPGLSEASVTDATHPSASRPDCESKASESFVADNSLDTPLEHVLEMLAQDLDRPAATYLWKIRQTRINAPNADRTFCCRVLGHFFVTHGDNPRHDWVARSVTALLDLPDPLDATHARHLFEEIQDDIWQITGHYGSLPNDS